MTSHIICRKCGGQHFTIKCGQDKPEENKNKYDKPSEYKNKYDKPSEYKNKYDKPFEYKNKYETYRVKISELPNDLTENEIMEQLYEWGDILKLKVINHIDTSIAYIDFKYKDQSDYFIKALHKTDFDNHIINVISIN